MGTVRPLRGFLLTFLTFEVSFGHWLQAVEGDPVPRTVSPASVNRLPWFAAGGEARRRLQNFRADGLEGA
jgi:hypothetical protein